MMFRYLDITLASGVMPCLCSKQASDSRPGSVLTCLSVWSHHFDCPSIVPCPFTCAHIGLCPTKVLERVVCSWDSLTISFQVCACVFDTLLPASCNVGASWREWEISDYFVFATGLSRLSDSVPGGVLQLIHGTCMCIVALIIELWNSLII